MTATEEQIGEIEVIKGVNEQAFNCYGVRLQAATVRSIIDTYLSAGTTNGMTGPRA